MEHDQRNDSTHLSRDDGPSMLDPILSACEWVTGWIEAIDWVRGQGEDSLAKVMTSRLAPGTLLSRSRGIARPEALSHHGWPVSHLDDQVEVWIEGWLAAIDWLSEYAGLNGLLLSETMKIRLTEAPTP